jgi:PIN domain nuclease of toxin-antitoxin system
VRLLLDTHALIWFLQGDERLPPKAREAIEDADNDVYVSAATAWEIAAKYRKGKLQEAAFLVSDYRNILQEQEMIDLPVNSQHALRSGLLELKNGDPFDRMILAQALIENLVAVSIEEEWTTHGVIRLWD